MPILIVSSSACAAKELSAIAPAAKAPAACNTNRLVKDIVDPVVLAQRGNSTRDARQFHRRIRTQGPCQARETDFVCKRASGRLKARHGAHLLVAAPDP